MKLNRYLLATAALLLTFAAAGCHHTAQGIKADTRHALDKTGHGLERAGDKIDRR